MISVLTTINGWTYYDYNGILCKIYIDKSMCHKHLGREEDWKIINRGGVKLDEPIVITAVIYPVPEELIDFERSLIIEKEHKGHGEQVEDVASLIKSHTKQYFEKYLNKN